LTPVDDILASKPAIDSVGNVFVSDLNSHATIKIQPSEHLSVFAVGPGSGYQNGVGTNAKFSLPSGIVVTIQDNLLISHRNIHCIRFITPSANVTTVVGKSAVNLDGIFALARLSFPHDIVISNNEILFFVQLHSMRKIDLGSSTVSTVAGSTNSGFVDGVGTHARFNKPFSIAVEPSGNLVISDFLNHSIRGCSPSGQVTIAGNGVAAFADGDEKVAGFNKLLSYRTKP
jgi:hypothetical protein